MCSPMGCSLLTLLVGKRLRPVRAARARPISYAESEEDEDEDEEESEEESEEEDADMVRASILRCR